MSVDYAFFPRQDIGKPVKNMLIHGSYEGYRISQSNIFCNLVGLPQIPYYYCFETDEPVVDSLDSDRYWELYFNLDFKYSRYDLHRYIGITHRDKLKPIPVSKGYKAYRHWQEWGLKKLEKITIADILNNPNIERKDIYVDIVFLEEIKQDIIKFLWHYKNHYYRFSLV